ncbi:class I SAM-dependent methyltransferase [Tateyamaria omphalii]|uniref:class I SAM-dependent methyltransferase n=1 Tax=Tateyamaria omphalii TaxID=299262 RepID=UPI001C9A0172|nr:class I SAM-dependent methyltransferase [Tateyamaria omphalii]MBY5932475.1 class I SAM-dependent methyltransferase [Tateyamaria omphalii]
MSNAEQEEFWTSDAGPNWVSEQESMDALLAPVLDLLLDRAPLMPGDSVLDIGCGTGVSVAEAARHVGPSGHVTGLDISQTMLDLAARRTSAANTSFLKADAQTHRFDTHFDAMISRFGVMFFNDTVAAFANLDTALAPGGTMTFAAWGPAPQNPYFMVPAKAAVGVLGEMPKVDRTLPGPFAFEDSARVLDMMTRAGLTDPSVETVHLDLTPPGNATDTAALLLKIGPAQRALDYHQADEPTTAQVSEAVADAIAQFDTDLGLRIPACIHIYTARKPA